jgi:hypothetical protein
VLKNREGAPEVASRRAPQVPAPHTPVVAS